MVSLDLAVLEPEDIPEVIDHERYEIEGYINRGCWGKVYKAKDTFTGKDVAIKVLDPNELAKQQMEDRNLTLEDAVRRESAELELEPCSNVVPRKFEVDRNGLPFIVMPLYNKFLSQVLTGRGIEEHPHKVYDSTLHLETALRYLVSIAKGLSEMHVKMKRAHSDLKPDNLAVDKRGEVLLTDLGTATCISMGMSEDERSNMGLIYTRAPECFEEGAHPTERSDVWSFGSLMYKMFTGRYIMQEEIDNSKDPVRFMRNLDAKAADIIIKKKIKKNIPKRFQKILRKMLDTSPYMRFYDGEEMLHNLEETIADLDFTKRFKRNFKKWFIPIATLTVFVSALTYLANTYEPEDLHMPKNKMYGPVILNSLDDDAPPIRFKRESIPEIESSNIRPPQRVNNTLRRATDNRYVAHFMTAYDSAVWNLGTRKARPYTDAQHEIYMTHTDGYERSDDRNFVGPVWPIIAKSIEYGLNHAQNSDGTVDLEDVCAIARLGIEKVNKARRAVDSFDFNDYLYAKDAKGKHIISSDERRFLKTWLIYLR
jgi:serine/threonine protein kinase